MTDTARAILVAAAVGVGLVLLSRASSAPSTSKPVKPPTSSGGDVPATFVQPPAGGILAPFYAIGKPIADTLVSPGVRTVNHAIGSGNPWDSLKDNGDGTYTDGLGARITPNANGTVTRKNPDWRTTNGGKVIVAVGRTFEGAASSTYHFVTGLF